jgi:hypothetical protein
METTFRAFTMLALLLIDVQRLAQLPPEARAVLGNVQWIIRCTRGGASPQILKKIFRRYIQNKMSQKIVITAKP